MVAISVEERELPRMSSGSFALSATPTRTSTAGSSQISQTALITPPSADGNPNIWRSHHLPDGLIYIIVGAIVGTIFLLIIVWYAVSRYMSRKIAKRTMYENGIQWRDTPSGGLYEHGDEKELYESIKDHSGKNELRRKRSLIGLLGGNTSYDTLADTDNNADEDLLGGTGTYQERLSPVQDFVPNPFPRSSLFISPTLEVVQQKQQQQHRLNQLPNVSVTSIPSVSEGANNNLLGRPERTASPAREPKTYGRYHQKNKSSTSSIDLSNANASTTGPSKFLNNLLEGKDGSI